MSDSTSSTGEPEPIDLMPAEGPAFPLGVRLLATLMVGATLYWGVRISPELAAANWATPSGVVLILAGALAVWCLWAMWRSRTRVDHDGIHQSWIRDKHVRWDKVTQARLIGVPYLSWLITPRLVVRPHGGGVVVFHSADTRVLTVLASFAATGSPLITRAGR